ncbi:hypothetical protein CL628_01445 [bacterium]|nr:hypothetical protein [bacterium]
MCVNILFLELLVNACGPQLLRTQAPVTIVTMTHHTCTECGSESEAEGVCPDAECIRQGKELISCDCTDGEHGADDDDDYHARG